MLSRYALALIANGSQSGDMKRDALIVVRVEERQIYSHPASREQDIRFDLETCLQVLRNGDMLVAWKLDRLGHSLHHLIKIVSMLSKRRVDLKVPNGEGMQIDRTTAIGRLSLGISAALAEFERELIRLHTMVALRAVWSCARKGGRAFAMIKAEAAMVRRCTSITRLYEESDLKPNTLYRYAGPNEALQSYGKRGHGA